MSEPARSGGAAQEDMGEWRCRRGVLLTAIRDHLKSKIETVLVESSNNEFLTGIVRREHVRVSKLEAERRRQRPVQGNRHQRIRR